MPELSVLLPTYNGALFLREQVDSILAQSFADFELIACDDGSSDDTPALLEDYARRDVRVRLLPSSGNLGHKRRLRQLAAEARGELIAVSDQDDVWAADKLALLVAGIGDADLAFGSSWLVDETGASLGRTLLDNFPPPPRPGDRLTYFFRPAVSAHAMLGRRRLFSAAPFVRDGFFDWLQALDAAFGRGIVHVPQARTEHRMHGANQTNGANAEAAWQRDRFTLAGLRRHLGALGQQRLTFFRNAEHLANSDAVPLDTARSFGRILERCRWAWYDTGRLPRWRDQALQRDLTEMLQPFAGSESDWAFAMGRIEALTRSPLHPTRLASYFGEASPAG
jgi:glycosyltransferase involved in cell wall biosynthesis